MKNSLITAALVITAFCSGAGSMYLLKRPRNPAWIEVMPDGGGLGFKTEALNGDIPWPETTKPSGRIKFLDRDGGEQLGYVIKLPMKPNPTAALPEKYSRTVKGSNGFVFGPPDQVLYEGHFEFTLKDADGFVLTKMEGPIERLSAGSENSVQGITEQAVPLSAVHRTKKVEVSFTVTSCVPCDAN